MLIDFHTHAFPDALAEKAIPKLAAVGGIEPQGDGTIGGLLSRMDADGVDCSVICHIATNPHQQGKVNSFALEAHRHPRLYSLGSLNPDSTEIESEARRIADAGLRGIKIHPDYCGHDVNDHIFDRIYAACLENNLFVVTHAGWDFASPDRIHCTPEGLLDVMKRFPSLKLVAAHLGSNRRWEDALSMLVGKNLWLDTSLAPEGLKSSLARSILTEHDPDKLLFGSDFPWCTPGKTKTYLDSLALPADLYEKIYFRNALSLLGENDTETENLDKLLKPLTDRIDAKLSSKKRLVLAIDGRCGSGKTTAAAYLAERYRASVIHMDDFFLPPECRTPERLAEPGGNFDRERFLAEIVPHLHEGKDFSYRRFDCSQSDFAEEPVAVPESKLLIVEGSYSLHPALRSAYALSAFLTLSPKKQYRRLLARVGHDKAETFLAKWIPLEEAYFAAHKPENACDVIIKE